MPALTAVALPVDGSIVATVVVLLLHAPPVVISLNVVTSPAHISAGPMINDGKEITFRVVVAEQPVPTV